MAIGIEIACLQRHQVVRETRMTQQLPQLTAVDAAFSADEQQQRRFRLAGELAFRVQRREAALRHAEQFRTAAQGIVVSRYAQRIGALTVGLHAGDAHHALRRTCRCGAGLA